jgi:hypothetical protein
LGKLFSGPAGSFVDKIQGAERIFGGFISWSLLVYVVIDHGKQVTGTFFFFFFFQKKTLPARLWSLAEPGCGKGD